jgi:hypothetical protein
MCCLLLFTTRWHQHAAPYFCSHYYQANLAMAELKLVLDQQVNTMQRVTGM